MPIREANLPSDPSRLRRVPGGAPAANSVESDAAVDLMEQGRTVRRPKALTLAAWGGTGAMLATTALATVGTTLHSGPLNHWMWPATGITIAAFAVVAGANACSKSDRRVHALSAGGVVGSFIIPTLHATLNKDRFYQVDKWVGCFALGCSVAAGFAKAVALQEATV